MIAAPTGIASAMWVVDLDLDPVKKTDGAATLALLIAQHGEIPKTLMTITPRGGRHSISFGIATSRSATAPVRLALASTCAARVGMSACRRAATPTAGSIAGIPTGPTQARPGADASG